MSPLFSWAAWTRPYALPFVGLFALNLLAFLAFTLPFSIIESGRAKEAVQLREVIAGKRGEIGAIRAEAETIRSNKEQTAGFYRMMPSCGAARVEMNLDLYQIATSLGVRWERQTMDEDMLKGASLLELKVAIPLTGTYERVGGFLQKIESSKSFLVVDRVGLRESAEAGTDLDAHVLGYCTATSTAARGKS